eukprot:2662042-Pyramimonas_sp.AAC.1
MCIRDSVRPLVTALKRSEVTLRPVSTLSAQGNSIRKIRTAQVRLILVAHVAAAIRLLLVEDASTTRVP